MDKKTIILGSGGHAKVLIETLLLNKVDILGIITKGLKKNEYFNGFKILSDDDNDIFNYKNNKISLVNGIGQMPGSESRLSLAKKMRKQKYEFLQVIHPSAIISSNVNFKSGIQIMAGAIVQNNTSIGEDTIINTGVIIEHDCVIGKNVHIASGTICCGNVSVGNGSFVGAGSTIIQGVKIGAGCLIAAGSVVDKDVDDNKKFIKRNC